jgi:hypothetical protein
MDCQDGWFGLSNNDKSFCKLVPKKLKEPYSFQKNKSKCKERVKHISDFEETATDIAIEKNMITSYVDTFTNPKSQKKQRMVLPCI